MSTLFHILLVVAGVGFLIFIHELGHFLVAKWVGVRVERFSLGFGPVIVSFRRGETEYALSWIPLGGYVKMSAENPGDPASGSPWEFSSRTVGERAMIAMAGIAMNAVTAVVGFTVAYLVGVGAISPAVGGLDPSWPAWEAGIREGDVVEAVGDAPIRCYEDLIQEIALQRGATVPLTVRRSRDGASPVSLRFDVARRVDPGVGIPKVGINPVRAARVDKVFVSKDYPFAAEGILKPGDRILSVEGQAVATWRDVERSLLPLAGKPAALRLEREGAVVEATLQVPSPCTAGIEPLARIVVQAVAAGQPAHAAGLRKDDQIVALDGSPVETDAAFRRLLQGGEPHPLSVAVRRSDGTSATLSVEPDVNPLDGKRTLGIQYVAEPALPVLADPPLSSPAFAAGLRGGDLLVSAGLPPATGGAALSAWTDLERLLSAASGGGELVLHYQRKGAAGEAKILLPDARDPERLGLEPAVLVGNVQPGSPAERLGLIRGDRLRYLRLVAPPGATPQPSQSSWGGMNALIQLSGRRASGEDPPLRLDWVRDGPEPQEHPDAPLGVAVADVLAEPGFLDALGVYPDYDRIELSLKGAAALAAGARRFREEAVNIVRTVRSLFAPKEQAVSARNLGGVITIVMGADQSLESGLGSFLLFLGIISVNLAVLNLLPIPVLDGGLLLLLALEKLRGAPLSERALVAFQYAGLALLLPLVLFVTYNDITERLVPMVSQLFS